MNILSKKISVTKYIQFLFFCLVGVTPLLMSSATSEIFEFNKMMFIYLITVVVSVLFGIQIIVKKEKFVSSFFFGVLVIFLISQLLSTLYSIDQHTSIFGYYGRWNGGFLSIVSYILLVFIFIQTFTVTTAKTFLKVSLWSSFVVAIWGLLAKFGMDFSCYIFAGNLTNDCWTAQFNPAERMFSTIGQPNWLGAYLAFHFFVGIYFFWTNRKVRTISIIYALYVVLNFAALYFTKSRSSLIAVLVSLGVGGIIVGFKMLKLSKRAQEIAALLIAFTIFLVFFVGWSSGYVKDFFSLPTEATAITDSFDIRKVVWKGAIDLGYQYPLFGSGVETFAYAYYFTRPIAHNLTSEWDFIYNKAHNEYLNYFATTGFIGLSAYLLVIIGTFMVFWRYIIADKEKHKLHDEYFLVVCLMLGYITILITNFFGFSVSTIQILFYLTPAVGITLLRKDKELIAISFKNLSFLKKIALGSWAVVGILGVLYIYNYYAADIAYAKAKVKMDSNDYQSALLLLDSARRKKYEHVYEDKLSYTLANLAYLYSFDDRERANTYISLSDVSNLKTLQESPENILYWRTRGKNFYLYYQVTNNEADLAKALEALEEMVRIAPTDAQSYYTLALFYWIASSEVQDPEVASVYYSKALAGIRTVLDLRPTYIEAQELLAEMLSGV